LFGDRQAQWIKSGTLMHKEFLLPPMQDYATLFVSPGIGYHNAYLNSKNVGDHQMDPGWNGFEK
jgi:hypothetical protein